MGKLVLFRHAESVYGSKMYAGNVDIPLSSNGIEQAKKLSNSIHAFNFDIVYTSKLNRAIDTALIMLAESPKAVKRIGEEELSTIIHDKRFLPFIELEALNERDYGTLQNKNKDQILEIYSPEEIQSWRRGFYSTPPCGESFFSVVKRVREVLSVYVFPYVDQNNILIVAHQNTMRAIFFLLLNKTPIEIEHIEFANCESVQFEINKGKVEAYNVVRP